MSDRWLKSVGVSLHNWLDKESLSIDETNKFGQTDRVKNMAKKDSESNFDGRGIDALLLEMTFWTFPK